MPPMTISKPYRPLDVPRTHHVEDVFVSHLMILKENPLRVHLRSHSVLELWLEFFLPNTIESERDVTSLSSFILLSLLRFQIGNRLERLSGAGRSSPAVERSTSGRELRRALKDRGKPPKLDGSARETERAGGVKGPRAKRKRDFARFDGPHREQRRKDGYYCLFYYLSFFYCFRFLRL